MKPTEHEEQRPVAGCVCSGHAVLSDRFYRLWWRCLAVTILAFGFARISQGAVDGSVITGRVGVQVRETIVLSSLVQPMSWRVNGVGFPNGGTTTVGMPAGLVFTMNVGVISGVPTQADPPGASTTAILVAYQLPNFGGESEIVRLRFFISPGPPIILKPPESVTVTEGEDAGFVVLADGEPPLSYEWRQNQGTVVQTGLSPALYLKVVKLAQAGSYTATIQNSLGSITTDPVELTVLPAATKPSITSQPNPVTIHPGEPLQLVVEANGTGPLKYEWRRGDVVLPDQTGAALNVPSATAADGGEYVVNVSNSAGAIDSTPIEVTVLSLLLRLDAVRPEGAILRLQTIPGRQYTIQASTALPPLVWDPFTSLLATNSEMVCLDTNTTSVFRCWRYGPVRAGGGTP